MYDSEITENDDVITCTEDSKFEELRLAGLFGPKCSILDTIGRTPTVRLNNMGNKRATIFAKLESFNPLGSVKDRLALSVIEDGERSGALKLGQTVVEATSGNTGIGLAMVCAQKGYPLVIVMAENFSVERRKLMRFLGARVILTPASGKGSGMLAKARELAQEHGWFLTEQFSNPANSAVHARTTAMEILADFDRIKLDYWVTGSGTGGTLKGVGETLKRHSPHTRIVVAEPDNAPMLASGLENDPKSDEHPLFRPHPMQGWSPDFLSKLALKARDSKLIDQYMSVSGQDAMHTARQLAAYEGILAGITGGATIAAALRLADSAEEGANILAMVPDTGERYLSTPLFEGIEDEMNEHELEISRSTAGYRFDSSKPVPARPVADQVIDPKATEFVDETINDPSNPIVMFALEWCEFCWSVRRLFGAASVKYKAVDLDAASFVGGQPFAGEVRKELSARTGSVTIPQIFIGGAHIGGATELFDAFNDGSLKKDLKRSGMTLNASKISNAYDFLPKWLHRRN
jgi:cysteine synthase